MKNQEVCQQATFFEGCRVTVLPEGQVSKDSSTSLGQRFGQRFGNLLVIKKQEFDHRIYNQFGAEIGVFEKVGKGWQVTFYGQEPKVFPSYEDGLLFIRQRSGVRDWEDWEEAEED